MNPTCSKSSATLNRFTSTDPVQSSITASSFRYAVISPVRDESKYIEKTIESMTHQTTLPVLWVIVNDGSRDGTELIVQRAAQEHPWIKLVNLPDRGARQRGKGVIEAFYAGFYTLTSNYDFLVKLDGDVSFEPNYFECLLQEFCSDPLLGIAGGGVFESPDGETWKLHTVREHVRGATKMYRRACFEAIGGLPASMGWDGIDEWKALSLGWKVQSFLQLKMYHYRFTGAATGFTRSYYEQGYGAFRMGYHPLYMVARGLGRMIDRPFFIGGMAMIWAYLWAWLSREEKLAEPSVVRYIRRTQLRKLAGAFVGRRIYGV
jgi:biofilm PGA synthesis N-glycosyltransferase PgaC